MSNVRSAVISLGRTKGTCHFGGFSRNFLLEQKCSLLCAMWCLWGGLMGSVGYPRPPGQTWDLRNVTSLTQTHTEFRDCWCRFQCYRTFTFISPEVRRESKKMLQVGGVGSSQLETALQTPLKCLTLKNNCAELISLGESYVFGQNFPQKGHL